MKVYIDLSSEHSNRIDVKWDAGGDDDDWQYALRSVQSVEGGKFDRKKKYWHLPLSIGVCRDLRNLFGNELVVSKRLAGWARREIGKQQQADALYKAQDGFLTRLPQVLPDLAEALHDYQRAAVVFSATRPHVLIADQPGLGKTLETIGAIYEAGTEKGPQLIIAPKTSLETVWEKELERWANGPVYIFDGTRKQREAILHNFMMDKRKTKWLVTNPEAIRYKKEKTGRLDARTMKDGYDLVPSYPEIYEVEWSNVVVDECHKGALRDPSTQTAKALCDIPLNNVGKRIALSGTPMKNRALDLWGILHWLYPDKYTSRWQWAERYIEKEEIYVGRRGSWGRNTVTKWKGIRKDKEKELQDTLKTLMIRRRKSEVRSDLPPKQYVDVKCKMSSSQKKQYNEMVDHAETRLASGDKVTATNILTELLRLKQFAICTFDSTGDEDKPIGPTSDSGKLSSLIELLDERELFEGGFEPAEEEKVVVFSQFSQVVNMVADHLAERGAHVAVITGDWSGIITGTKRGKKVHLSREKLTRKDIQDRFQVDGGPRVLCMTTTAGGVAITLDRADSVFFMDETWSPADMEQAEDRVHRPAGARMHEVTIYKLRSEGTVDESIQKLVKGKEAAANLLLDAWREGSLSLK